MSQPSTDSISFGQKTLICIIASIGFAFDIYELLMLPLVLGPALQEFGIDRNARLLGFSPFGWLFFGPALAGGVFGLLGGYLTDLWGRRRVLTWSILLYAFSALAAGFSTSFFMLFFFRCLTFIGVCVEFVAAVAWLAELFPNPKQREAVLGFTQFFSSLGGLLVTAAYALAVMFGDSLPAIYGGHAPWRYTLISGVIPALPLIIIRPFLPESPLWAAKKAAGTLGRPSIAELFAPNLFRTTIVTTIMFACSYGAAFGAIQHLPRIVPGLSEVREPMDGETKEAHTKRQQTTVAAVQGWQEAGGLAGRFIFAALAMFIISRRNLLRIFQIPGLIVVPAVFAYAAVTDLNLLMWGAFLAGMLTVAQFSFWGNYLPLVYPTRLRGTGESFAANIGGRMIGTSAALVTTTIAPMLPKHLPPPTQLAYTAAGVGLAVYLIGSIACFFLPEPGQEELKE